jgi:hypothetical protein
MRQKLSSGREEANSALYTSTRCAFNNSIMYHERTETRRLVSSHLISNGSNPIFVCVIVLLQLWVFIFVIRDVSS